MASFYRTSAGAEIDLLLEFQDRRGLWAIEIKRSLSARPSKGFHSARADLEPQRSFIVHGSDECYPIARDLDAVSLPEMARLVAGQDGKP